MSITMIILCICCVLAFIGNFCTYYWIGNSMESLEDDICKLMADQLTEDQNVSAQTYCKSEAPRFLSDNASPGNEVANPNRFSRTGPFIMSIARVSIVLFGLLGGALFLFGKHCYFPLSKKTIAKVMAIFLLLVPIVLLALIISRPSLIGANYKTSDLYFSKTFCVYEHKQDQDNVPKPFMHECELQKPSQHRATFVFTLYWLVLLIVVNAVFLLIAIFIPEELPAQLLFC